MSTGSDHEPDVAPEEAWSIVGMLSEARARKPTTVLSLTMASQGYGKSRAKIQGARNPAFRGYVDTEHLTNSVPEVTRIGRGPIPSGRCRILRSHFSGLQRR